MFFKTMDNPNEFTESLMLQVCLTFAILVYCKGTDFIRPPAGININNMQ